MGKRKISDCINIRINVGNYQHIELVKYAEEEIEFLNSEERQQKEDQLRDDLVASMIRSMKAIPEKLGKGIENAVEIEQSIKKAIPEWMSQGAVPNIANNGKKLETRVAAEQKAAKDKATEESMQFEKKSIADGNSGKSNSKIEKDLNKNNIKKEDIAEEKINKSDSVEHDSKLKDNLFDDDDLFGDK